ncbi:aliphatic amidase expression-regulating protein, partial [Rhodovulum sp. NI22]
PNHHISPLIDYLFTRFGQRAFCIGSNYIWGWESNRVLREGLQKRGGEVLAERYVPVGETDLNDIIEEIMETRPNFVFNALIGESSYSFFRAFRNACREKGIDQVAQYPVASCNLSEPELRAIGADGADGQISSSVYFSSLPGARNARFVRAYQAEFPEGPVASAEAEAAYVAIHMLAKSVAKAGTADVQAVCQAAAGQEFDAPQGKVTIDPDTLHASLTPRIGLSRSDYEFDLLFEASEPVKPDPYLVSSTMTYEPALRRSMLRAVS